MTAIRAEALTIEALFKKGSFEPARVQRDFQWTAKECGQLLNDLEAALLDAGLDPDPLEADAAAPTEAEPAEPAQDDVIQRPREPIRAGPLRASRRKAPQNYFLGPMVLYPRPQAKDAFYIYDGQQRFTTLSILLAALRDHLKDENWQDLQEMLRTTDGDMRARLRVATPGGSLSSITNSLGGTQWRRAAYQSPADLCMYRPATQFTEATKIWSDNKRRAFVNYLRKNVIVTVTYVDNPTLAHVIFETANTRGRGLSPGDILKGHLVQIVYDAYGAVRGNAAAVQWERTRRALGAKFDHYLKAVDFVVFGKARDSELGEEFLDEFEGPAGADAAINWIDERLPRYLNDYKPIWAHEIARENLRGVDATFKRLSFFRWREWEAVAMALHNRDGAHPEKFAASIEKLHRACMIMHLIGWHSRDKSRAKALSNAIDQIDDGLNPFVKRMKNGRYGALSFFEEARAQARGALRAPLSDDNEVYGPIVRWLESLDWPDGVPPRLFSEVNVEHILPRAHSREWVTAIPNDADREICKSMLGNLCLLPQQLNSDLVNESFAVKRAAYATANASIYRGAHEIAAYTEWNDQMIRARTEKLAARAEAELGLAPRPA
jgi:Protein of unknown function DUF262/Protein of unknown function (DUF1524)